MSNSNTVIIRYIVFNIYWEDCTGEMMIFLELLLPPFVFLLKKGDTVDNHEIHQGTSGACQHGYSGEILIGEE